MFSLLLPGLFYEYMVKSSVIRDALFLESVFADDLLYVDNAKNPSDKTDNMDTILVSNTW